MFFNVDFKPVKPLLSHLIVKLELGKQFSFWSWRSGDLDLISSPLLASYSLSGFSHILYLFPHFAKNLHGYWDHQETVPF